MNNIDWSIIGLDGQTVSLLVAGLLVSAVIFFVIFRLVMAWITRKLFNVNDWYGHLMGISHALGIRRIRYVPKPSFVSAPVANLLIVLQKRMPAGQALFAQVTLAQLLETPHAKSDRDAFEQIANETLDLLVCGRGGRVPLLVIRVVPNQTLGQTELTKWQAVARALDSAGLSLAEVRASELVDAEATAAELAVMIAEESAERLPSE